MKTITKRRLRQIIREAMEIDLEVGDIILTGKFKNKRSTVKEVGVDDKGQPTVNGRPLLKFRIEKLMPKDRWSAKSKELLKKGELNEGFKMKITRRQLRRIIREAVGATGASDGKAIFNQWLINAAKKEMSNFDDVIVSFEAETPDVAEDLEDIRDTIAHELSVGQPASQGLRDTISDMHTTVRDAIPAAPYYWVFPEEME
ncbi:MAG TPA: hypothetical protein EYG51_10140 [Pseudomonadales bacterium]|nr:hypothetical protein [Pseudomonadales bacterium]